LTTITDDPLLLGSNNTEAARITTGGEFLIGTTLNPNNSQLTVNGTTTTDGVVISSGGITGGAQLASAVEFIQFNAAGAVELRWSKLITAPPDNFLSPKVQMLHQPGLTSALRFQLLTSATYLT
jgi:hypothetical protein